MFKKIIPPTVLFLVMLFVFPIYTFAKTASFSRTSAPHFFDEDACKSQGIPNEAEITRIYTLTSDRDSALADGSDAINLTGTNIAYYQGQEVSTCEHWTSSSDHLDDCNGQIWSDDAGVNVSVSRIHASNYGGKYVTNATVTSTNLGTKTINYAGYYNCPMGDNRAYVSFTLDFTSGSSSTATNATNPKTTATSKLSSPTLSTINSQQLPENKISTQIIREGEPITFSGKTVANATIKLYIYSDPITAEVKSDKDGNWSYTLTQALPVGEHRVEAQVTDTSGKTSDKVEIAKFTIKPVIAAVESIEPAKSSIFSFSPLTYGLAALALIFIGVLVYSIIKRKKLAKLNTPSPTSQ